jgi:hypothetical protein
MGADRLMERTLRRNSTLEVIARNTLKNFDPELLYGTPTAIPIEKIAEHLGITIEYQCLRKNGLILGEMVYDKTYIPVYFRDIKCYDLILAYGGTMFLDESLLRGPNEGRLRFTCGHEIAHWILDKNLYSGTGRAAAFGNPKISSEENPAVERQANLLSTMLLLPTAQVKKAFNDMRNIKNVNAHLAELFEVSKQAMNIFMQEHNMI